MKKLLISLAIFTITSTYSLAHIDTNHTTTENYLLNTGYSADLAKYAEITTRDPYAPTDDIYPKMDTTRFFKLLWKKIDPTAFPNDNSTWHSIQLNTGFTDL